MSILSRAGDILSANINAVLDKLEDPSKMIDQYLRDAMDDFAEVKVETAKIVANEKQAKRALDEANTKVTHCHELAMSALKAGNEDDARKALAEEENAKALATTALNTYNAAAADAKKMREVYECLAGRIADLQARREHVKAQAATVKAHEAAAKVTKNFGAGSKGMDGFARMEQAMQAKLDAQEAMAELEGIPTDGISELEAKYGKASPSSVDDALAALKAEMAGQQ